LYILKNKDQKGAKGSKATKGLIGSLDSTGTIAVKKQKELQDAKYRRRVLSLQRNNSFKNEKKMH